MSGPAAGEAGLHALGNGRFALKGPVVFRTARGLLEASRGLFGNESSLAVDLSEVTRVDSAALALLLEWLRQARAEGRRLRYEAVPDKLHAIAGLSGVEGFISAGAGQAPTPGSIQSVPSAGSPSAGSSSQSSSQSSSRK